MLAPCVYEYKKSKFKSCHSDKKFININGLQIAFIL